MKAMVFDLFGTLVPPFPRVEQDAVLDEYSALVGIDAAACRQAWRDLYRRRITGEIGGIDGHLRLVAGRPLDDERVRQAVARYRDVADALVRPVPGAVEVLQELSRRGTALGLLSNSQPDIADAFARSPLAPCFDAAVFSCSIGVGKPEPGAYRAALDALGASPADTLFVGDGSDDELSGAARVGMTAVLLRVDVSGSYDPNRPAWDGRTIDKLEELLA